MEGVVYIRETEGRLCLSLMLLISMSGAGPVICFDGVVPERVSVGPWPAGPGRVVPDPGAAESPRLDGKSCNSVCSIDLCKLVDGEMEMLLFEGYPCKPRAHDMTSSCST
ncbi:hypothetical protein BDN67DRAFT_605107 [Paxillus ammoniavirescens]|nr:hypothetical protein BDN67DRAFT_605107 [Paxillus ammoniavirescens]